MILKKIFLLITFNAVLIFNSNACFCFDTLSVKERIDYELKSRDAVIFSGKVIDISYDSSLFDPFGSHPEIFTFQLESSWRNVNSGSKLISVYTKRSSCGAYFEMDSTYLVYGKISTSSITLPIVFTDECTRTKSINLVKEDLKILGEGKIHEIFFIKPKLELEPRFVKVTILLLISFCLNLLLIGYLIWSKLKKK